MPLSERWREQGPRLAAESIVVVASVVLALAVLEWRQDAEVEERRERPTETISSEPLHDVRAFHERLAGTRLALSKTSAESVEPGVRPEGSERPGDLVWISGCLAVLLACQSEPVVGSEAEAVPVAPQDAPSSGQQLTPVADSYVADGGDRHENFAAAPLLQFEQSGDRRALARWGLDVIAAIPYREGWLLRKSDDEAKGSVASGSRESGAPPGLVLTTGGQECELASPPDSLPRTYYVEDNLVQNPVCSKARFWGHPSL